MVYLLLIFPTHTTGTNFLPIVRKELVGFVVGPEKVVAPFGGGLHMRRGGRRYSGYSISLTAAPRTRERGNWLSYR